ncbi:MAG: 2-acyl-glycerophospho-ethanolamine acyltransferase [Candidatus Accumulibacter adjunctus]|uniref:2-acyl-glycerophospho-ethanolamine acyltransferase n=1 Tax=Candidatus Accumulibacter adjunctus TaxID=1454001 RepID=A0A011PH35_9PROT|nr:MAG: 2-acyl-glycerophospho-ethanolamine acyltransferase [Candidatus Accumulibacter adjunctus]
MKGVGRLWRSLVSVLCFVAFAVGGTLMSAVLMPLLMSLPGPVLKCRSRARSVIGFCFRLLVRALAGSGCMRLETHEPGRLARARGTLVVANHPTYCDVVVLISLMPQANCVVKAALWRNPFYWGIVRAAGYISNASPEGVIEACAEALRQGETLLLFPEGTRTTPGQVLRFQRGAAHVALRSGATVMPVLIGCDPPALTKDSPWWLAPENPFTIRVDVGEELPMAQADPASAATPAIRARHLTNALQDHFSRELRRHGYA